MMTFRRIGGLAAAVTILTMLAGCRSVVMLGAGSAVGAGSVAYIRGELQSIEPDSVSDCYQATLKAMKNLELKVISQAGDQLTGSVEARQADGTPVVVKLERQPDGNTMVGIRVGLLGSESRSHVVLSRIRRYL